jgi:hypothetical protein
MDIRVYITILYIIFIDQANWSVRTKILTIVLGIPLDNGANLAHQFRDYEFGVMDKGEMLPHLLLARQLLLAATALKPTVSQRDECYKKWGHAENVSSSSQSEIAKAAWINCLDGRAKLDRACDKKHIEHLMNIIYVFQVDIGYGFTQWK